MVKRQIKEYVVSYSYNNGTTSSETIKALSALNALNRCGAWGYLKNVMHQTGSKGEAIARATDGTNDQYGLYCEYQCGKWHATYGEVW